MRRVLVAFLVMGLAACTSPSDLHGISGKPGDWATPSPTAASAESGVAESRQRYRAARERLLYSTDTTIEFRYDVILGDRAAMRTRGTADLAREEWVTETVASVPGRDEASVWHAVSSRGRTWMQMEEWEPPAGGCWLQMGPREVPLGVTGLLPRMPAYLALPRAIRVHGYLDSTDSLRATLRLDMAATMLPGQILEKLKGVSGKRARREDVELVVNLGGSRLDGYVMEGPAFRRAWAYAGGSITPEGAQALTGVQFRVRFPEGQKSQKVRAPDSQRIFTSGEEGCGIAG